MHIPKWLIAAAGLLVVVLIAAVAFFMGRETSRPPAAPTAAVVAPLERSEPPVASAAPEAAREEPKLPPAETGATAPTPSASVSRPSVSAEHPPVTPANDDARARVAAYFKQMEAIQEAGSGDPQAFATTIANAAAGGDFSGLDELIRSATDAERRAAALQPPSECAEYHRQAVALLQESRAMIAALREGLKRNDTNALNAASESAQTLKTRAESLAQSEKALRARFGL